MSITIRYPYKKVKFVSENCYNFSISQFGKYFRETLGYYTHTLTFTATPFIEDYGRPFFLEEMDLPSTIIGITIMSLAAHTLSKEGVFKRVSDWAALQNDDFLVDTVDMLIQRVTGDDEVSVRSAVHLAYYEAHLYRTIPMYDDNLVLPDSTTCQRLSLLAKRAASVIAKDDNVAYRADFTGAYTSIINRGAADFMSDTTVWAVRLHAGQPTSNDHLYLLIAYILACHSDVYKTKPIRYLRIVNPIEGVVYSADMTTFSPQLLRMMEDCIYGQTFADPDVTTLGRFEQTRLIMAMVRLLDVKDETPDVIADEVKQICAVPDNAFQAKMMQNKLTAHFSIRWGGVDQDDNIRRGILLLNQFFYHIDNAEAPEGLTITLHEDRVSEIMALVANY